MTGWLVLDKIMRGVFFDGVIFEQRSEEVSHADIWGKAAPGRGNGECRGAGVEACCIACCIVCCIACCLECWGSSM